MRKIILTLVVATLLLTLVACTEKPIEQPDILEDTITQPDDTTEEIEKPKEYIIPEGATYWSNNSIPAHTTLDIGHTFLYMSELGEKFEGNSIMPELKDNDIFIADNILYLYNPQTDVFKDNNLNGWVAMWTSNETPEEISILSEINGQPVVSVEKMFRFKPAPQKITIPETVTNINQLLYSSVLLDDTTIVINGNPTQYLECLKVTGNPTVIDDKLVIVVEHSITITGDCDKDIKENIAKEITEQTNIIIN